MRRRLSLSRLLLQEASVAHLDEPNGQLDPPGFRLMDRVLCRLRESGASVLLATHLLERGRALCDEAICLEEGRLIWAGRASDLPEDDDPDPSSLGAAGA
jgi:ABC-type multidrug transport system ATPase subunit